MKKLFLMLAFTGIVGAASANSFAALTNAPAICCIKTDDKEKSKKKEKSCCKKGGKACTKEETKACAEVKKGCCKGGKAAATPAPAPSK